MVALAQDQAALFDQIFDMALQGWFGYDLPEFMGMDQRGITMDLPTEQLERLTDLKPAIEQVVSSLGDITRREVQQSEDILVAKSPVGEGVASLVTINPNADTISDRVDAFPGQRFIKAVKDAANAFETNYDELYAAIAPFFFVDSFDGEYTFLDILNQI